MHDPISFEGNNNGIQVRGCFQYTDDYQENVFSFTNMVRTRDGGSHELVRNKLLPKCSTNMLVKTVS